MSYSPKNLPQCTRTTVMDHLFRREYELTYVETIIMAYLALAHSWAIDIDGYFLIRSSKIKDDLIIGDKTIEATITKLKKLELIETKLAKYQEWSHTQNYRTVKITPKGKKYNLSYHKPKEYQYTLCLEEELKEYKAKNELIEIERKKIKEENHELEGRIKASFIFLENQENLNQAGLKAIKQEKELKNKIESLEKSLEEAREIIRAKEIAEKEIKKEPKKEDNTPSKEEIKKEKNLDIFRRKIIKEFSSSSKVLCNGFDGWNYNVHFYINTYNRVAVRLLSGKFEQLTDMQEITNFWKWLFENQDRVGKIVPKPIPDNIMKLMVFEGKTVLNSKNIVKKIEAHNDGVTILIQNPDTKKEGYIKDSQGNISLKIETAIIALKKYVFGKG